MLERDTRFSSTFSETEKNTTQNGFNFWSNADFYSKENALNIKHTLFITQRDFGFIF